jgi:hypothetical protein
MKRCVKSGFLIFRDVSHKLRVISACAARRKKRTIAAYAAHLLANARA